MLGFFSIDKKMSIIFNERKFLYICLLIYQLYCVRLSSCPKIEGKQTPNSVWIGTFRPKISGPNKLAYTFCSIKPEKHVH